MHTGTSHSYGSLWKWPCQANRGKRDQDLLHEHSVCFSSLTSPSVHAIFLWKLWPLQHTKPKHNGTGTSCNQIQIGWSKATPNLASSQSPGVPGSLTYRLSYPNCQAWGKGLWPSPPTSVACQPPSNPLASMPQWETPTEWERDMKEDEKGPGSLCWDGELQLVGFLPPSLKARHGNHTLSSLAWYRVLLNNSHLQEPMDEMSQTPPGYSRLNHMHHLQTLPCLLADKTALSMKSLFIFLFRNFTRGTDSHKHCKGALYFSWLVHTWRLEFRFQLFGVQNSTHIFGLISAPQLFLAAGLGRNETKSSQHFAHCVLCFLATSHQLLHTFYCQRQMVKLETWKISQLQLPESVPEPLGTIEVKSQIRQGNL